MESRAQPGDSCGLFYFLPGPVPGSVGKQRVNDHSQTESDCVSLSVERYLNELTQRVTPSFRRNRCLLLVPYPITQPTITLPQRLSLNVYIVIVPVPEIVQAVFHTQKKTCNTPIWSKNSIRFAEVDELCPVLMFPISHEWINIVDRTQSQKHCGSNMCICTIQYSHNWSF